MKIIKTSLVASLLLGALSVASAEMNFTDAIEDVKIDGQIWYRYNGKGDSTKTTTYDAAKKTSTVKKRTHTNPEHNGRVDLGFKSELDEYFGFYAKLRFNTANNAYGSRATSAADDGNKISVRDLYVTYQYEDAGLSLKLGRVPLNQGKHLGTLGTGLTLGWKSDFGLGINFLAADHINHADDYAGKSFSSPFEHFKDPFGNKSAAFATDNPNRTKYFQTKLALEADPTYAEAAAKAAAEAAAKAAAKAAAEKAAETAAKALGTAMTNLINSVPGNDFAKALAADPKMGKEIEGNVSAAAGTDAKKAALSAIDMINILNAFEAHSIIAKPAHSRNIFGLEATYKDDLIDANLGYTYIAKYAGFIGANVKAAIEAGDMKIVPAFESSFSFLGGDWKRPLALRWLLSPTAYATAAVDYPIIRPKEFARGGAYWGLNVGVKMDKVFDATLGFSTYGHKNKYSFATAVDTGFTKAGELLMNKGIHGGFGRNTAIFAKGTFYVEDFNMGLDLVSWAKKEKAGLVNMTKHSGFEMVPRLGYKYNSKLSFSSFYAMAWQKQKTTNENVTTRKNTRQFRLEAKYKF